MNRRATIVLLLIAVLLAGFLALTRSGTLSIGGGEGEEEEESPYEVVALFEGTEYDEAIAFSITDNETGDRFAAEAEDVGWNITESPSEPEADQVIDTLRLYAAGRTLTTLTSSRELSQLENLAEYGLESARYTLSFSTRSGGQFTLDIGDATPQGTHYYTQRRGDELVNLVSTATLDTFIGFLTDPPFIEPTPTPEPTAAP